MDVKHGEPHVREELRMWRKRALKLQARVEALQAEVAKLKKYNKRMSETCSDYDKQLTELEADNKRLRGERRWT